MQFTSRLTEENRFLNHTRPNRSFNILAVVAVMIALAFLSLVAQHAHASNDTLVDSRDKATASPTPPANTARPTPTPLQSRPEQQSDQTNSAAGETVDDDDEPIRIETELVNLQVRVIDQYGRPLNDVRQEDFRIYENGAPQTIQFFSRENVPVSYGLLIDNSGSLRSQLESVREASKTIVNSNKPGDETFLIRFIDSDKIDLVQDFTSNSTELLEALDEKLYIDGGQTAVIDAVYLGAEYAAKRRSGNRDDVRRRAIILVTDGEERGSSYSQEQLFARLREEGVQIFVIGFVGELDKEKAGIFRRNSEQSKATDLINRLARETGGRAFFPKSLTEMPQIAEDITRDLRTQYVIGYQPTNTARDGSYRAIRVAVNDDSKRNKRIALTRAGYTQPTQPSRTGNRPSERRNAPAARPTATPTRP